jgi:hypothetical protein
MDERTSGFGKPSLTKFFGPVGINNAFTGFKNKTRKWFTKLDPRFVWHLLSGAIGFPDLMAGPTLSGRHWLPESDAISGLCPPLGSLFCVFTIFTILQGKLYGSLSK